MRFGKFAAVVTTVTVMRALITGCMGKKADNAVFLEAETAEALYF